MAAIIAKLTRENRERKLRLAKVIPIWKSNYELEPFDDHFIPAKHNKVIALKKITLPSKQNQSFIVCSVSKANPRKATVSRSG